MGKYRLEKERVSFGFIKDVLNMFKQEVKSKETYSFGFKKTGTYLIIFNRSECLIDVTKLLVICKKRYLLSHFIAVGEGAVLKTIN